MRESLPPFLFGLFCLVLFAASILQDDSAHMNRNPHQLSE